MHMNKKTYWLLSIIIVISTLLSIGNVNALANTKQNKNSIDLEKDGAEWLTTLTVDEKNAITYYTGQNYMYINYYLRSNKQDLLPESTIPKPELDKKICLIDSAINKAVLKEDIIVYRNTGEQEFKESKYFLQPIWGPDFNTLEGIENFEEYIKKAITLVQKNINKTYTAPAYTSTSLQKDTAFGRSAIRMEIQVPKGTHAPYIDSISKFKGEQEVLLPRGSKFKITGASTVQERGQNTLIIRATFINDPSRKFINR
ncbi:ADP-ribosyltransferase [Bacillus cereus]|nr:ADP-ribosyltransferase [Bacillus cereus]